MTSADGNVSSLVDGSRDFITTENPLWFCHNETTGPSWELSKTIVYWVEGFSLTTTAVLGMIGNLITCLVLKKLGRLNSNVFNQVSKKALALTKLNLANEAKSIKLT